MTSKSPSFATTIARTACSAYSSATTRSLLPRMRTFSAASFGTGIMRTSLPRPLKQTRQGD